MNTLMKTGPTPFCLSFPYSVPHSIPLSLCLEFSLSQNHKTICVMCITLVKFVGFFLYVCECGMCVGGVDGCVHMCMCLIYYITTNYNYEWSFQNYAIVSKMIRLGGLKRTFPTINSTLVEVTVQSSWFEFRANIS